MSANVNSYLGLVTSEHKKPNYLAMLSAFCQAQVDQQNVMNSFSALFDVDLAVGDQLDKIGNWVGVSRNLNQSLLGVTVLPDASYRLLIKLFIAQNVWDGTIPGIYSIWNTILQPTVGPILIQDNQDMTMLVVLLTPPASLLSLAIVTQGYFLMRPAGVRITGYFEPSLPYPGTPLFGFDVENTTIAGFDIGAWIIPVPGPPPPEVVLFDKFGPHYPDLVVRAPFRSFDLFTQSVIDPNLLSLKEQVTIDKFAPEYPDWIVRVPARSIQLSQTVGDSKLLTLKESVSIDKFGPHYSDAVAGLPSTAIRSGIGAVKQVI